MTLIPNQHAVKTLPAKRPDQTLDVRCGVGRTVRDRNRLPSRMSITCHSHASNTERHDLVLPAMSTRCGRPGCPNFPSLSGSKISTIQCQPRLP